MGSLALARVKLLEMVVNALARADKEKNSPQREAELAAYFHLKRLGSKVVGRNWRSGHHPGDIDLIAWEGETLCFVDVGIRTPQSASAQPPSRRPAGDYKGEVLRSLAKDYLRKASYEGAEVRYDLIMVDLKQDRQPEGQGRSKSGRPRAECEYSRGVLRCSENHITGRAGPCEPGFAVIAIVTFTLTSFLNRLEWRNTAKLRKSKFRPLRQP